MCAESDLANTSNFVFFHFSILTLITYLKVFLDSDWDDLDIPGNL